MTSQKREKPSARKGSVAKERCVWVVEAKWHLHYMPVSECATTKETAQRRCDAWAAQSVTGAKFRIRKYVRA